MDLHLAYRPQQAEDLVGNEGIVKALKSFHKKKKWPHTMLLTGPSGCGKTTIARIIARELGVTRFDDESDSGVFSGVDAARRLVNATRYTPFGGQNRVFILDECHAFSQQSWNALLKTIEEAPPFAYFIFSTTVLSKVPRTVKTRCYHFAVQPVVPKDLRRLLSEVAEAEGLLTEIHEEDAEDIIAAAVGAADGSPRQALVNLGMVANCETKKEAKQLLSTAEPEGDAVEIARLVAGGKKVPWKRVTELVKALEDQNPETVRILVLNYLTGCAMRATRDADAMFYLEQMAAFEEPYKAEERWAPLLLSVGRCLYQED